MAAKKDENLRYLSGHKAKEIGEKLSFCGITPDNEYFKKTIREALWQKINTVPGLAKMLSDSDLPIVHYYVMRPNTANEFTVPVNEHNWLWKSVEEFRDNLKNGTIPTLFTINEKIMKIK